MKTKLNLSDITKQVLNENIRDEVNSLVTAFLKSNVSIDNVNTPDGDITIEGIISILLLRDASKQLDEFTQKIVNLVEKRLNELIGNLLFKYAEERNVVLKQGKLQLKLDVELGNENLGAAYNYFNPETKDFYYEIDIFMYNLQQETIGKEPHERVREFKIALLHEINHTIQKITAGPSTNDAHSDVEGNVASYDTVVKWERRPHEMDAEISAVVNDSFSNNKKSALTSLILLLVDRVERSTAYQEPFYIEDINLDKTKADFWFEEAIKWLQWDVNYEKMRYFIVDHLESIVLRFFWYEMHDRKVVRITCNHIIHWMIANRRDVIKMLYMMYGNI